MNYSDVMFCSKKPAVFGNAGSSCAGKNTVRFGPHMTANRWKEQKACQYSAISYFALLVLRFCY